eukprot:gene8657-biopygen21167
MWEKCGNSAAPGHGRVWEKCGGTCKTPRKVQKKVWGEYGEVWEKCGDYGKVLEGEVEGNPVPMENGCREMEQVGGGVTNTGVRSTQIVSFAAQCSTVDSKVGCTVHILVNPHPWSKQNPPFGPLETDAHSGGWGGAGTAPPAPCRRGKAEENHSIAAPQAPQGGK